MTELDQLTAQIKQATDYQINKQLLREKIQTDLHFAYNGGLFKATQELIGFLNAWDSEEIFLEDTYQNPIKVNRQELLSLAIQHYHTAMNAWHIQHEELKRVRKV
jgi:hypothetical protein